MLLTKLLIALLLVSIFASSPFPKLVVIDAERLANGAKRRMCGNVHSDVGQTLITL
jgi:hypothetical protein